VLESIRQTGVEVVEAIVAWRQSLGTDEYGDAKPDLTTAQNTVSFNFVETGDSSNAARNSRDFVWDGEDYLCKMYRDLQWLDHERAVSMWLGFRADHNPFVIPPHGSEGNEEKEYVCKMSQKTRERAEKALSIIKCAIDKDIARRALIGGSSRFERSSKADKESRRRFGVQLVSQYDSMQDEYMSAQATMIDQRGHGAAEIIQRAARAMFSRKESNWRRQRQQSAQDLVEKAATLLQGQVRVNKARMFFKGILQLERSRALFGS